MSVQPMSVVTYQPCTFRGPDPKTEMWSSGMFDCCQDTQICCLGFWCPCCLACQVSSGLGESHCLPLLDWISGGPYPPLIPPISLALRSTLRERYRIQGSIADDCCMVTCCSSCSWCQMARELKARRSPTHINITPTAPPGIVQVTLHPSQPTYTLQATPMAGLYPPMAT
ncbi:cornifelin homolog isoform X2 [Osmerus eperlanus]|uniref:cornifelin homolog isoform X2 n=1 Tax=Osmerus eperlanus TaxID=29151 RepID=UPI002E0DF341